jgi:DNA-binding transcriptional MerR regulator
VAHELAKLLLEQADTFLERKEAVKVALRLGMPLHKIEEYLDWLDSLRSPPRPNDTAEDGSSGPDAVS